MVYSSLCSSPWEKKIRSFFSGKVDEEALDSLEKIFYESDLGVATSQALTEKVRKLLKKDPSLSIEAVLEEIKALLLTEFKSPEAPPMGKPHVILVEGVNGNGKTTTVAKLAKFYKDRGKKVLIAAADTFRAAAIEQLEKWAHILGVDIVKGTPKSDPAAVVFDAIQASISRGIDVVIIDTAGRLHTKTDLMRELEKIVRVSQKALPGAPHETLLVLDSTIGQNSLEQAKIFHQFTPLTGLIVTKLDGSAKGGVVVLIHKELHVPIRYIGVGEGLNDLQMFDPESFVKQLFL